MIGTKPRRELGYVEKSKFESNLLDKKTSVVERIDGKTKSFPFPMLDGRLTCLLAPDAVELTGA